MPDLNPQQEAERSALNEALKEFSGPPKGGDLQALERRLSELERMQNATRGEGGIVKQGETIRLNAPPGGGGSDGPRAILTLSKNGLPQDYSIDAFEV